MEDINQKDWNRVYYFEVGVNEWRNKYTNEKLTLEEYNERCKNNL